MSPTNDDIARLFEKTELIGQGVARLEEKLGSLKESVDKSADFCHERHEKLDGRMGCVEGWQKHCDGVKTEREKAAKWQAVKVSLVSSAVTAVLYGGILYVMYLGLGR